MVKFVVDRSGNIATMFAIIAPALLAVAGAALDFSVYTKSLRDTQTAADTAAIAAAKQIFLGGENAYDAEVARSVASAVAVSVLESRGHAIAPTVAVEADLDTRAIDVSIEQQWKPGFLSEVFGVPAFVEGASTALARGTASVCVIALNTHKAHSIKTDGKGRLIGNGCAFFANSRSNHAIRAERNFVQIKAEVICSTGGFQGGAHNIDPVPLTDCPPKDDPLADRPEPTVGLCDHNGLVLTDETRTLAPGVYCGGLTISGASDVTFETGVHVIEGGDFVIDGTSSVVADYASFYIASPNANVTISGGTTVEMTAQRSGPLAGILIFQTRAATAQTSVRISSNDARKLVGTIYVPRGRVNIDAGAPVADESAYTAIVADRVRLGGQAQVVLNTNYSDTDVPAPEGVVAKPDIQLKN